MYDISSLYPAEVGQDKNMVVGRDTRPSVAHASVNQIGTLLCRNHLFHFEEKPMAK